MPHISEINVGTSILYSVDVTARNDNKAGLKTHRVRAVLNPLQELVVLLRENKL